MNRLAIWLAVFAGMMIAVSPATAVAQADVSVTGVGEASLPSGTQFNGVALSGVQFESGVVISANGSAVGEFHGVLFGTGQSISLEGQASSGSVSSDGSAMFTGLGTLDLGNGQTVPNVPFTVSATAQGLLLNVGDMMLPEAAVIAGSITIAAQ